MSKEDLKEYTLKIKVAPTDMIKADIMAALHDISLNELISNFICDLTDGEQSHRRYDRAKAKEYFNDTYNKFEIFGISDLTFTKWLMSNYYDMTDYAKRFDLIKDCEYFVNLSPDEIFQTPMTPADIEKVKEELEYQWECLNEDYEAYISDGGTQEREQAMQELRDYAEKIFKIMDNCGTIIL